MILDLLRDRSSDSHKPLTVTEYVGSPVNALESFLLASGGVAVGVLAVALTSGSLSKNGKEDSKPLLADTRKCDSGSWDMDVVEPDCGASEMAASSTLITFLAIPALVGSWCWPVVVASLIGFQGLVAPGVRAVTHSLLWGVTLGALIGLALHIHARTLAKRGGLSARERWTPLGCILLGSLLVMLDLTRHLLLDQNIAPQTLRMYTDEGGLTAAGCIGVITSWIGVGLLVVGTAWFAGIWQRIKQVIWPVPGQDAV